MLNNILKLYQKQNRSGKTPLEDLFSLKNSTL